MSFSLKAVFGIDATGVRTELKSLRREMNSFVSDFLKLGAGTAIGAFVALSKGAIDFAKNLKDTAQALGINFEALQVLHYAATQNGSSVEAMDNALGKLRFNTEAAATGSKQYAEALGTLHLNAQQISKLPLEQQMTAIASAYHNAADKGAAYNAVVELFGGSKGSGRQMISVLEALATDGFPKIAKSAAEAGHLINTETGVALDAAGQAIENFKTRATVAVGNILVNFRTEEGIKLLWLELSKVVITFGTRIIDAIVDAGGMVHAVLGASFGWAVDKFRDGWLESIAIAARALNKILPASMEINIGNIEALKSSGESIGDRIIRAIAETKPSTLTKDVTAAYDELIRAQQLVVDQLNKIDLGPSVKKLTDAGKKFSASTTQAADAFNPVMRAWSDNIKNSLEVAHQMGGLLAGIRGGAVFNELSDEALKEVVRQNRAKAAGLDQGSAFHFGDSPEIGRLQAEALNAQQELDLRNRFRTDIARQGVEGARRDFDPVIFEKLLQRFGPGSDDIQNKQLNAQTELLQLFKQGIKVAIDTP